MISCRFCYWMSKESTCRQIKSPFYGNVDLDCWSPGCSFFIRIQRVTPKGTQLRQRSRDGVERFDSRGTRSG
jgi:hypothetical protein